METYNPGDNLFLALSPVTSYSPLGFTPHWGEEKLLWAKLNLEALKIKGQHSCSSLSFCNPFLCLPGIATYWICKRPFCNSEWRWVSSLCPLSGSSPFLFFPIFSSSSLLLLCSPLPPSLLPSLHFSFPGIADIKRDPQSSWPVRLSRRLKARVQSASALC